MRRLSQTTLVFLLFSVSVFAPEDPIKVELYSPSHNGVEARVVVNNGLGRLLVDNKLFGEPFNIIAIEKAHKMLNEAQMLKQGGLRASIDGKDRANNVFLYNQEGIPVPRRVTYGDKAPVIRVTVGANKKFIKAELAPKNTEPETPEKFIPVEKLIEPTRTSLIGVSSNSYNSMNLYVDNEGNLHRVYVLKHDTSSNLATVVAESDLLKTNVKELMLTAVNADRLLKFENFDDREKAGGFENRNTPEVLRAETQRNTRISPGSTEVVVEIRNQKTTKIINLKKSETHDDLVKIVNKIREKKLQEGDTATTSGGAMRRCANTITFGLLGKPYAVKIERTVF